MTLDKENKTLSLAQKDLSASLDQLSQESASFEATKQAIREGETYLRQTERIEVKAFDNSFVERMEGTMESLSKIVANPRSFLREDPEVVEAGLVKKVSSRSVAQLSSHAHFVQTVDEKNNVIPKKLLTTFTEMETQIYENRFIMTLIRRCLDFLQERYVYITEHGETFDSDLLLLHTKTEIDGLTYSIDTRVQVREPSKDMGESERNNDLLLRLGDLRQKFAYFLYSPFMEAMKGAKEVSSPIHMTNILHKQPDYHKCYELWNFLDEYESLGISYDVTETNQRFDKKYYDRIYSLLAASLLTLSSHRVKDRVVHNEENTPHKTYEPEVIFTLEDETYDEGRFLYNHFPQEKEKRPNPLALTPEEAKAEQDALKALIEEQRKAKPKVEADILQDKDRLVLALAKARKEAQAALLKARKEEEKKRLAEEKKAAKEAEKQEKLKAAEDAEQETDDLESARKIAIEEGQRDRALERE